MLEEKQIMEKKKQAREEAYKDVKMYIANDWELKEETPEYFLITRRNTSTMVHIFLFLFTWGIGNIIYHYAKTEKKKILK